MKILVLKATAFAVAAGLLVSAIVLGWLAGVYLALGPLAR